MCVCVCVCVCARPTLRVWSLDDTRRAHGAGRPPPGQMDLTALVGTVVRLGTSEDCVWRLEAGQDDAVTWRFVCVYVCYGVQRLWGSWHAVPINAAGYLPYTLQLPIERARVCFDTRLGSGRTCVRGM